MKIASEVLNVLANSTVTDNTLYLPPDQLERKLYEAVNKCLTNIGGKWNRKAKGHVFDYDPSDALDNLILTGETEDMKKTFQFFPTPRDVAVTMCDMAGLDEDSYVLEPSIGRGDLADVIYEYDVSRVEGVELNPEMEKYLADKPYAENVTYGDFLAFKLPPMSKRLRDYTHIIMNPPFSKQQDIDHIRKAYDLLDSDGGVLVSVCSVSPFFRTNKKSVEFRDWLDALNAEVIEVDSGAFKESGTMIPARIIMIEKRVSTL